ncbi:hypothetical protein Goklo_005147 [Gossypium klotzschianum]|uniref:DUF674 domain-containing protein n=1 Tax=Gossypium klotzschianum TaxID=34286 RepID=A0A7J8VR21_9ROSI|nr:hypothetical protein [Gossypium klotzschianum]
MAAPTPSPTAVSLKLLIDPIAHRVLFAEATKDFVDFLFNIMSLPVGTVIRLLNKQGTAGCIGNIYDSIENLSESYMLKASGKDILLKPMVMNYSANVAPLLPIMEFSKCTKLYRCCGKYVTNHQSTRCPCCFKSMNNNLTFLDTTNKAPKLGEAGFVKGVIPYVVMDDIYDYG